MTLHRIKEWWDEERIFICALLRAYSLGGIVAALALLFIVPESSLEWAISSLVLLIFSIMAEKPVVKEKDLIEEFLELREIEKKKDIPTHVIEGKELI